MHENNRIILAFADASAWEAWLAANHFSSDGLWIKLAKKDSGHPSVTYAQAVEGALCYGWIDGQKDTLDHEFWLQRFTPRRPRSIWSQVNRDKVAVLLASGRMREAGLREIEAAKADGRWDAAYASPKSMTVPEELQTALDASPTAQAAFAALKAAERYAILYRVSTAKRPETKKRHLDKALALLEGRDQARDPGQAREEEKDKD